MCRFSKLLLFSFFFCKDGSDRLMKRASYSCCNFLCIALAAAYLKYRLCRLSCLPFGWHPFFIVTHTHTHTHSSCVCAGMPQFALVVAVILKCSTILAVISEYSTVSVVFPLTSLLSSLYWPWDPLSSLESTVSI